MQVLIVDGANVVGSRPDAGGVTASGIYELESAHEHGVRLRISRGAHSVGALREGLLQVRGPLQGHGIEGFVYVTGVSAALLTVGIHSGQLGTSTTTAQTRSGGAAMVTASSSRAGCPMRWGPWERLVVGRGNRAAPTSVRSAWR
jgi:hypothetical protein